MPYSREPDKCISLFKITTFTNSNMAVSRAVEHVYFCLCACAELTPQVDSIAVSLDCQLRDSTDSFHLCHDKTDSLSYCFVPFTKEVAKSYARTLGVDAPEPETGPVCEGNDSEEMDKSLPLTASEEKQEIVQLLVLVGVNCFVAESPQLYLHAVRMEKRDCSLPC